MPINVSRLRYWFAVAAIFLVVVVAGFYLYDRVKIGSTGTELPARLPNGVQQSSHGFSLSKSEGGHSLFTIRAERTTQYKEGGKSDLQDVKIVVYGHDANRFDQIYGPDFLYDPQSGDVVAKGIVHIDLQGDNSGAPHADQAPPGELKNPIHLVTSGLLFNQKTGNADTKERVDFHVSQATGWATGAHYDARQNQLALDQDVHIDITEPHLVNITADRGFMSKSPRCAILYNAHIVREDTIIDAAQLTLFLRPDNSIDHMTGAGGVSSTTTTDPTTVHIHAPSAVLYLEGTHNDPQLADFTEGTSFSTEGASLMNGSADNVHMVFGANNNIDTMHAQGNVRLIQPPKPRAADPLPPPVPGETTGEGVASSSSALAPGTHAQTTELTADVIDFWLAPGNQLRRAETSRNAQITMTPQTLPPLPPSGPAPAPVQSGERTVITAAKFYANFKENRLDLLTGFPNARVVAYTPGLSDRVSTSRLIEVAFAGSGGASQVTQQDAFQYHERLPNGTERAAWAQSAVYSTATGMITLTGAPRVVEGDTATTAHVIRMNRPTGDFYADGDVKSTYNDLKPQPGGALLASGDPIHVTARSMTAQRAAGFAHYAGDARLWQNTNVVEAPVIDFDRDRRTMVAEGDASRQVVTILTQQDRRRGPSPIHITSAHLTYSDLHRQADFEGGVVARGVDGTLTASQVNAYLTPVLGGQSKASGPSGAAGQIDKMTADQNVVLQQPSRRATGDHLTYTAAIDEYVIIGGPPIVWDAEHGTTTGDALTFYNHDDKVFVEGSEISRAVTHTRAPK
jgi:lipopolysaccharide export system protein LptA